MIGEDFLTVFASLGLGSGKNREATELRPMLRHNFWSTQNRMPDKDAGNRPRHIVRLRFPVVVKAWPRRQTSRASHVGVRIRGTLGDIDPLTKVPFKRATSRVQKGPL